VKVQRDINAELVVSKMWPAPVEAGDLGQALGLELKTLQQIKRSRSERDTGVDPVPWTGLDLDQAGVTACIRSYSIGEW
jgi:hypothetical protein